MDRDIQLQVRAWIGLLLFVGGAFWAYTSTDYLRGEASSHPVLYDHVDIVVLGDSITEGLGTTQGADYVSLLQKTYPQITIQNSGVRGDTTGEAFLRLEQDVLAYNPQTVIVFLGGNDFIKRVPKETTFANLELIVTKLKERGITPIVLGVPGGMFVDAYEDYFLKLQKDTGVTLVPNVLLGIIGKPRYMKDPLHPNDAGHTLIYERIVPIIEPLAQDLLQ